MESDAHDVQWDDIQLILSQIMNDLILHFQEWGTDGVFNIFIGNFEIKGE